MPVSNTKLGLIGGTFNPIHIGHLRAAEEISETMLLDKVLFIPAALPPHKHNGPLADFSHRLAMIEGALTGMPDFFVSDMEARRSGPSYTVDSLQQLRRQNSGGVSLYFIVGQEAFEEVAAWKRYQELFNLSHFVVISRPESHPDRIHQILRSKVSSKYRYDKTSQAFTCPGKKSVFCRAVTRLEISSTDIRSRLSRGDSIRYLVPDAVYRYIQANHLYQSTDVSTERKSHH